MRAVSKRADARGTDLYGAERNIPLRLTVIFILPVLCIVVALFFGRYLLSPSDVLSAFGSLFHSGGTQGLDQDAILVLQVRLPRALGAAAIGAALAASGAALQGVFRNPLVNPGLLGVSNGAGFGAALAIVCFGGGVALYPCAFLFGIIAVAASWWIARVYRSTPAIMLILAGTIVSSVFAALISLMKYLADADTQLPSIVYWLMGSLASVGFEQFWAVAVMAVGCIVLVIGSWRIDVLSMGDREARAMDVEPRCNKAVIIAAATLATSGAVCMAGTIGWVGLIIPHIGRMLIGSANRRLIPVSMALGASFLVIVDTCARSLWASEIPLGILTALIGAPFFVYLLKKTKGGEWCDE
jgi:iron complex transport system permease protein